jgi:hypothetical protein
MARLVAAELASRSAVGGSSCGFREINLTASQDFGPIDTTFAAATTPLCGQRCSNLVVLAYVGRNGDGFSGIHGAEALLRFHRVPTHSSHSRGTEHDLNHDTFKRRLCRSRGWGEP